MMKDTPRTDSHIQRNSGNGREFVRADFARELECENARLREDALRWFRYVDPSDLYPDDDEAYERWAVEARNNGDL